MFRASLSVSSREPQLGCMPVENAERYPTRLWAKEWRSKVHTSLLDVKTPAFGDNGDPATNAFALPNDTRASQ